MKQIKKADWVIAREGDDEDVNRIKRRYYRRTPTTL